MKPKQTVANVKDAVKAHYRAECGETPLRFETTRCAFNAERHLWVLECRVKCQTYTDLRVMRCFVSDEDATVVAEDEIEREGV